jgi:hypothetical protein
MSGRAASILLATVLLVALASGCPRSPQEPESLPAFYNQPLPAVPLSEAETTVGQMVEKWASKSGRATPELDPGLILVCRAVANRMARGKPGAIDDFSNATLQKEMLRYGISDSAVRTQMASSFKLTDIETRLGAGVMEELADGRYTHFGVGEVRRLWPPLHYVTLVFSRRPVRLDPFPKTADVFDAIALSGTLLVGLTNPIVYISDPSGKVREPNVRVQPDGSFRANVFFNEGAGVYRVEVGGDSPLGPEVAALMPVNVGGVADDEEATPNPVEDTEARAKILVIRQINRERRAAGLPPLAIFAPLARVAQSHAEEMRELKYAAHASPKTGMAADRATAAGIHWRRIGENVAVNQSAMTAHASLMESPGHRANVLDGEVTYVGVGVAFADDGHGHRVVYLVENFVALQ